MIPLYRPGRSLVHRLPAGVKLAGLAVLALGMSLWPHTVWTALGSLLGTVALFALGGFGPLVWARQLWPLRWLMLFLVVTQLIFSTPTTAVIVTARILVVILLAALLTLTTPTESLIEVVRVLAGPLARFGVDPWRVAFVITLTIALIPVVASFSARVREAQRARGVRLGVRGIVTLLVMTLRHADEVGDALTARGVA